MVSESERQAKLAANVRNVVHSIILVGGIGGIMAVCAFALWGGPGVIWSFVLIVLLLLMSPRIAPELIMRMYGARKIEPRNGAAILRLLEELARRAELPAVPQLYVIPSPIINAFATGVRTDSLMAVTDGMLNQLSPRELAGVLAHETAHIRHNDLWIMNLADTMSRFTHFMSMIGVLLFIFNLPMLFVGGQTFPWAGILLLYFAPTASNLMQLGLSRAREYEADREGARLSGDPEALASALNRIERAQGRVWENIMLPGRRVPTPSLLRSHPPTEERIKRLLEMSRPHRAPLQLGGLDAVAAGFMPARARPRYRVTGLWY